MDPPQHDHGSQERPPTSSHNVSVSYKDAKSEVEIFAALRQAVDQALAIGITLPYNVYRYRQTTRQKCLHGKIRNICQRNQMLVGDFKDFQKRLRNADIRQRHMMRKYEDFELILRAKGPTSMPPLARFDKFVDLPVELQLMIFELSIPDGHEPRVIEVIQRQKVGSDGLEKKAGDFYTNATIPALLHASKVSRTLALKQYSLLEINHPVPRASLLVFRSSNHGKKEIAEMKWPSRINFRTYINYGTDLLYFEPKHMQHGDCYTLSLTPFAVERYKVQNYGQFSFLNALPMMAALACHKDARKIQSVAFSDSAFRICGVYRRLWPTFFRQILRFPVPLTVYVSPTITQCRDNIKVICSCGKDLADDHDNSQIQDIIQHEARNLCCYRRPTTNILTNQQCIESYFQDYLKKGNNKNTLPEHIKGKAPQDLFNFGNLTITRL